MTAPKFRPRNKAQLAIMLTEVAKRCGQDYEVAHAEADALLLAYINDPQVSAAWNSLGKWYA